MCRASSPQRPSVPPPLANVLEELARRLRTLQRGVVVFAKDLWEDLCVERHRLPLLVLQALGETLGNLRRVKSPAAVLGRGLQLRAREQGGGLGPAIAHGGEELDLLLGLVHRGDEVVLGGHCARQGPSSRGLATFVVASLHGRNAGLGDLHCLFDVATIEQRLHQRIGGAALVPSGAGLPAQRQGLLGQDTGCSGPLLEQLQPRQQAQRCHLAPAVAALPRQLQRLLGGSQGIIERVVLDQDSGDQDPCLDLALLVAQVGEDPQGGVRVPKGLLDKVPPQVGLDASRQSNGLHLPVPGHSE
mmetsp:Transcript_41262/g.105068  ORF Transcript_41262/g.105068 Transcript_41262/m.105068 type:complete len:302 (-) Transcript_41262:513-1418(-)